VAVVAVVDVAAVEVTGAAVGVEVGAGGAPGVSALRHATARSKKAPAARELAAVTCLLACHCNQFERRGSWRQR